MHVLHRLDDFGRPRSRARDGRLADAKGASRVHGNALEARGGDASGVDELERGVRVALAGHLELEEGDAEAHRRRCGGFDTVEAAGGLGRVAATPGELDRRGRDATRGERAGRIGEGERGGGRGRVLHGRGVEAHDRRRRRGSTGGDVRVSDIFLGRRDAGRVDARCRRGGRGSRPRDVAPRRRRRRGVRHAGSARGVLAHRAFDSASASRLCARRVVCDTRVLLARASRFARVTVTR